MFYPQPYFYYPQGPWFRDYPPVDTVIFGHSVTAFQRIATQSALLLNKLAEPPFAKRLMIAAQQGNQQAVDRLIKSIGIPSAVTATYTPTGILFTIHAYAQGSQCCTLTMFLRWGN